MHAIVLAQVPGANDQILAIGGLIGLTTLVIKAVDFMRLLVNLSTNKSAVLTQLLSWAGGVGAIFLFAATDYAKSVGAAGTTLDNVSGATLVLVGLMMSSSASVVVDFKQSIDNSDTAAKPPILK